MRSLVRKLIPQTLGGNSYNIWNVCISRVRGNPDVYLDWRLNPHIAPENKKPLWDFVSHHKCKNILEIGLGLGENAEKVLELAGGGCDYYSFDNLSMPESQRAYSRLKDRENIHFYIGDTRKTLPLVVGELPLMDFIFIDGGHDYDVVKSDWGNVKRLVHLKTVVFFHDYNLEGVKKVVDEIDGKFSVEIIKPRVGSCFALVRRNEEAKR